MNVLLGGSCDLDDLRFRKHTTKIVKNTCARYAKICFTASFDQL